MGQSIKAAFLGGSLLLGKKAFLVAVRTSTFSQSGLYQAGLRRGEKGHGNRCCTFLTLCWSLIERSKQLLTLSAGQMTLQIFLRGSRRQGANQTVMDVLLMPVKTVDLDRYWL